MNKHLPTDEIANELAHSSFFQRTQTAGPRQPGQRKASKASPVAQSPTQAQPAAQPSPQGFAGNGPITNAVEQAPAARATKAKQGADKQDSLPAVMTSGRRDADLKTWQEIIENTETQSSALRLTREERYAVEDMVNELRRQEKIKTSMNEIARLGLLVLIQDFKQNRQQSLVYQVKKS